MTVQLQHSLFFLFFQLKFYIVQVRYFCFMEWEILGFFHPFCCISSNNIKGISKRVNRKVENYRNMYSYSLRNWVTLINSINILHILKQPYTNSNLQTDQGVKYKNEHTGGLSYDPRPIPIGQLKVIRSLSVTGYPEDCHTPDRQMKSKSTCAY